MPTTLNTNINTNNSINNYLLQSIIELGNQPTQTIITTSPEAQESPKYTPKTKTIKTPTIKSTYKSFTIQHGHFVPSTLKNNISHISHPTTLIISTITIGYFLTCKVNGVQQISVIGDDCHTDWKLNLQAGDLVEVEVLGGKAAQTITYTINEDGVVASATKGVNHAIKGTHSATLDIQDKYRKQAVAAPAPAQEVPAQIEEETVSAPAQEEQIINFGKHAGKSLSSLNSSYLKWLVAHESRLVDANRWACTAAKAELERRAQLQEA